MQQYNCVFNYRENDYHHHQNKKKKTYNKNKSVKAQLFAINNF